MHFLIFFYLNQNYMVGGPLIAFSESVVKRVETLIDNINFAFSYNEMLSS